MKFVAFFRNLNLGHGPAPSRAGLEGAFVHAGGAHEAASFQTNGTVAFSAGGVRAARAAVRAAQQWLAHEHGFDEPVFLRGMAELKALLARDPFAGVAKAPPVYDFYVTFVHERARPHLPTLPATNARQDVHVVLCTAGEVVSFNHLHGKTMGNPNVWTEQWLGLPATTRTWGTLQRLAGKFG